MSGFSNQILDGDGTLVRDQIQSTNFVTQVSGWILRADGSAELNTVDVRGSILVGTPGGQRIEIGPGSTIQLFDAGNNLVGTLQPGSLILDPGQQITANEFVANVPTVEIGNGVGVYVSPNINDATKGFGQFSSSAQDAILALGAANTPGGAWGGTALLDLFYLNGAPATHDSVALEILGPAPNQGADTARVRLFSTSIDGASLKSHLDVAAGQVNVWESTAQATHALTMDNNARTAKSLHAWNLSEAAATTDALQVQVDGDPGPRWAVRADGLVRAKLGVTVGTVTLVAGSATVPSALVDANSLIFPVCQTPGGAPGALRIDSRIPGTSFTIKSTSATDTSTVGWHLVEGF